MKYKVTYAIDSLDTQPVVKLFDEEYEAIEWMNDEIQRRIEYVVEHSQFSISEKEYQVHLHGNPDTIKFIFMTCFTEKEA